MVLGQHIELGETTVTWICMWFEFASGVDLGVARGQCGVAKTRVVGADLNLPRGVGMTSAAS